MEKNYMLPVYIVYKSDEDIYEGIDEIVGIYASEELAKAYIKRHEGDGEEYFIDDSCEVDTRLE